jgi:hypothetical protein
LIQIEKIQIYDLWRMIGDHLQIIYRSFTDQDSSRFYLSFRKHDQMARPLPRHLAQWGLGAWQGRGSRFEAMARRSPLAVVLALLVLQWHGVFLMVSDG